MSKKNQIILAMLVVPLITSCSVDMKALHALEHKAESINRYEIVSLKLAKENRELHVEVKRLQFEIEKLKQDKFYFENKGKVTPDHGVASHGAATHGETNHAERGIASVGPVHAPVKGLDKDYVEFKTYKWHADDMQKIADKEFKEKNFEKAAQFYKGILESYPHYKGISDEFYFKAGISAYESGNHHDWTLTHFDSLMTKYPTSQYFRSAKLWMALTHMKMGEKKKFFATVEEFRKKYRNTPEWKILSSHYEKIEEKTNE